MRLILNLLKKCSENVRTQTDTQAFPRFFHRLSSGIRICAARNIPLLVALDTNWRARQHSKEGCTKWLLQDDSVHNELQNSSLIVDVLQRSPKMVPLAAKVFEKCQCKKDCKCVGCLCRKAGACQSGLCVKW